MHNLSVWGMGNMAWTFSDGDLGASHAVAEALSSFFFSSSRPHTSCYRDWSSDVCSSDLMNQAGTAHYRVYRTIVAYNTLVEAKGGINVGDGNQYAPVDCVIADNIVQGSS